MTDKSKKSDQLHDVEDESLDESDDETIDEAVAITNICYDCRERIFEFLNLESLLMLACTCKRLQVAAAAKFWHDFGKKKEVVLYPCQPEVKFAVHTDEIDVFGLKFCLTFLRCFGIGFDDKTLDLSVGYRPIYDANGGVKLPVENYVDEYINCYCADTLSSVYFAGKSQFSNQTFKKPFKKCEKVELHGCDLVNLFDNIVNWFPKLGYLKISSCRFDGMANEISLVNMATTHLKVLILNFGSDPYPFGIFTKLLQANPQLQNVNFRSSSKLRLSTILNEISTNAMLKQLVVENIYASVVNVKPDELARFAVEHAMVEELVLKDYRLKAIDAINFVRKMKSMKRFGFKVKDLFEYDRI